MQTRPLFILAIGLLITNAGLLSMERAKGDEAGSQPALDVPALVREVRAKQKWIEGASSFHVKAESVFTQSPQAIEQKREELAQRVHGEAITSKRLPELLPRLTGTMELAFIPNRFYFNRQVSLLNDRSIVWDGERGLIYDRSDARDRESYNISTTKEACVAAWQFYFRWPTLRDNEMWWDKGMPKTPSDEESKAKDFGFLRLEKVDGVECYVLGLHGHNLERWSVGVKDHLLHRIENGNLATDVEELNAYRDEAKKRGVELETAEDINEWFSELSPEESEKVSVKCLWTLFATAKAPIQNWMGEYREIAPGCWYPFEQGALTLGYRMRGKKPMQEDFEHPWEEDREEIHVVEATVNGALPDSLFHMELKEGGDVQDQTFTPALSYKYKKNRTAAEWGEILREARLQQESQQAELDAVVREARAKRASHGIAK